MGIDTNLDTAPYFDDYNEENNYHQILFKPKQAVQARELTQLQTILQNQIERFGDNILVQGTVIKGGNFTDLKALAYVKIRDNNVQNQPVNMKMYTQGARVVGVVSGVEAVIVTTIEGLESQTPDLNTIYVRYTKTGQDSGGNDIKTFLSGETLNFYVAGTMVPEMSVAVAPVSADPSPIGVGYGVKCGDGIIYQKGFFVRFEDQTVIVSKYNNIPDGLVVGFNTSEDIINSYNDTSLLDNAAGFDNYNAPGADRLKLTPVLTVKSLADAQADETFFSIQEYQEGRLIRRRTDTQFNSINKELKKRTYEESGNYSVSGFGVGVTESADDPNSLTAVINPGVGYIGGERVEIISKLSVPVSKGIESAASQQQNVVVNYGSYIEVQDSYGSFGSNGIYQVSLRSAVQTATTTVGFTAAGSAIGTANVRAVKKSGGIVRLYVFNVKMNSGQNLSSVRSVVRGTTAFGNVVLTGGVVKDSGQRPLIFPLGRSAIKEVGGGSSDYVYYSTISASAASNGDILLTLSGDEVFPYGSSASLNSDQREGIIVNVTANGLTKSVVSASTDSTGTSLTMNIGSMGSATPITITVPVKRSNVKPTGKDLATVYVRVDCTGFTGGTYSLGLPDIYSIEGIWSGADLTFTESTSGVLNVTNNFTWNNGQTADYYGLGFIKAKAGFSITNATRLLIKAKVFRKNTSGDYAQSYFVVNSYPIDDVTNPLPANKIRTENIPSFKTGTGSSIDLRDYIDFRPYATNSAAYASTPAAATVVTSGAPLTTLSFQADGLFFAGPNEAVEVDYSYYVGRKDLLIIDDSGSFVNLKGIASENPIAPSAPKTGMVLATITIPPYPSLPSVIANRSGKPQYGVSLSLEDNSRYTMRDIGAIAKRVERLEYYTVLSALEKEAEDMVVTDASGLNRFKNGIFVDNFSNLMIADTSNDAFNASVDPGEGVLAPAINQFSIDMMPSGYSNIRNNNKEVLTLPYNTKMFSSVNGATGYRNCVTDFYNFAGKATIYPEYDNAYDETYAPDINMDIDLASAFVEYTENLAKFVPLSNVNASSKSKSSTATNVNSSTRTNSAGTTTTTRTTNTTTTKTTTKTITDTLKVSLGQTSVKEVGDFVTDVTFSPFMRANIVRVRIVGLRPNTNFWCYFDGVYVSHLCAAGKMNGSDIKNATRTGQWGNKRGSTPADQALRSNAQGELVVFFNLPANRFYVGDRDFMVVDVPSYANIGSAATSSAKITYRAFNYSVEKTGVNLSTRTPSYSTNTTVKTTTRTAVKSDVNVVNTFVPAPPPEPEPIPERPPVRENRWSGGGDGEGNSGQGSDGNGDPIAQTFMIEKNMTNDNVLFLDSIQIYFQKKSSNMGVTVQIRETDNGYPASKVLPFASVHLTSSQVNVSNNGTAATTVKFSVPVALSSATEYCFVIIPDGNNPDYLIWTGKTGMTDVLTKKAVTSDESTGTLFTSTNNRAWTPYQDENIKYRLFKAQFGPSAGYVNMVPNNYEFFELQDGAGRFKRGETAFVVNSNAAGTISVTDGSNTVTGVGTAFNSLFSVGDYIAIRINTQDYEVSRINEIVSATSMVLAETMKVSSSGRNYFKTTVGTVDYHNPSQNRMHLKGSSAKSGAVFASGVTIRGEITESVGVISSVIDVPISYVQNHYYRSNFINTATTLTYVRLSNGVSSQINSSEIPASFSANDYFNVGDVHLVSRSNEITKFGGARTFITKMSLENTKSYLDSSPVFDYDISSMRCYEYIINADAANEVEEQGNADARYISKVVELAEGLDAEDLNLWLTAYKPQGTDIKVYAKFKSATDMTDVKDVEWTELALFENTNFFSSTANREDFREIRYRIPASGSQATYNGAFSYTAADGSVHTTFKYFAIKIVMMSDNSSRIPKVKDMRAIALT